MHSKVLRWTILITVVFCMSAMACRKGERAPINRVQAMALDKHFFVGPNLSDPSDDPEFYLGNRIIDEPYGVGQGFFLMQSLGSMSRVKWEIQENVILARLTYDRIRDTDYYGARTSDNGQVVAEYNITSHFDIIRDHNPQTGEQLNVIVENTTDRPWYEREYFRVDWSKNLVTDSYDYDLLSQATGIEGVTSSIRSSTTSRIRAIPTLPSSISTTGTSTSRTRRSRRPRASARRSARTRSASCPSGFRGARIPRAPAIPRK